MTEKKKIKCRIALAVDEKGKWVATGAWWRDPDQAMASLHNDRDRYFVEVEVEVPETPTIIAEAKEVRP